MLLQPHLKFAANTVMFILTQWQWWASEGIFQGGPLGGFFKIVPGGGKSGDICFYH